MAKTPLSGDARAFSEDFDLVERRCLEAFGYARFGRKASWFPFPAGADRTTVKLRFTYVPQVFRQDTQRYARRIGTLVEHKTLSPYINRSDLTRMAVCA